MDITPLIREGSQIIQSYVAGKFRVSNIVYESPVVVFPEDTVVWDFAGVFSDLRGEDFKIVTDVAGELDVVLFGTGAKMEFVPPFLRAELKNQSIIIEPMDTGAACRTYNVLMAEGRRVAAMLIPVS